MPKLISEAMRREMFKVLVTGQDLDMSVEESRQMIADTYRLTLDDIIDIEKEGMRKRWPPLTG
jgi:hypothetical protein